MTAPEVTVEEQVLYSSTVTKVGEQVGMFVGDHGILVLFGADSPAELHDFSALHEPTVASAGPRPGDVVELGGTRIPVLAVGAVVEANLVNLGHIDFKANGATEADMPGDCNLPVGTLVLPQPGDTFRILRPAGPVATPEDAP
ncbi:PTS glucitol/sorbitol transporter subunit IIA [Klenkia brasiliensis]|uniref:PTS system D-sorbitol-specific IIA component, Gut family n=1 Tax=Klenkia brasiliensis TaxID=333142 RepID=A0A1G7M6R7_9ACTN|nr:PTS glucitol/sorbitol transporter subunit IIA [Klenkia brasiliensis]SDF56870.1 PTS system D-sorbitol-specific IIA component, Gut family [Klenkia brasiliensis]